MIWTIPRRRPGAAAQKSASHRLWARRSGPPELEVAFGGARYLHFQGGLGIEGRDRIREHDLGDDAVRLQFGLATVVVPVPAGILTHEIVERHPVLGGPLVELGGGDCSGGSRGTGGDPLHRDSPPR